MLDGLQGGHVARGVQVPDREALLVQGRLGEDHTELDLPGGARPSGSLPCRPAVSAGTAGIPVPSTATYSLAIRVTGPSGTTSPTTTAAAWVSMTAAIALPSASAQRSTLFAESSTPASSAIRSRPFLTGTAAPTRPTIAASPGASEALARPSCSSLGTTPWPQSAQWYYAWLSSIGPSTVTMVFPR